MFRRSQIGTGMLIVCGALIVALSDQVKAQEKATLTDPVTQPTITEYSIREVRLGRDPWLAWIYYVDNTGKMQLDAHSGIVTAENPDGADVMVKALNKANLNPATGGKTLECRAIEHLVAHGKIPAATCTGSPQ